MTYKVSSGTLNLCSLTHVSCDVKKAVQTRLTFTCSAITWMWIQVRWEVQRLQSSSSTCCMARCLLVSPRLWLSGRRSDFNKIRYSRFLVCCQSLPNSPWQRATVCLLVCLLTFDLTVLLRHRVLDFGWIRIIKTIIRPITPQPPRPHLMTDDGLE